MGLVLAHAPPLDSGHPLSYLEQNRNNIDEANAMAPAEPLPDQVEELLRLERRLEQEWWWINGALHGVAQLQAEGPRTIRELDAQARNIDRMRTAISVRLAQLCPYSC
jgi:hypothetical protein